ncbi:unnamed protein product, partial [Allacma fusca]
MSNFKTTFNIRLEERPTSIKINNSLQNQLLNCGWFQYLQVVSFFASNTFVVPWRLCLDKNTQTFRVTSPGYQKLIWIILHIMGLIVTKYRILDAVTYVQTAKSDTFRYFDFGSLIGIYVFDFSLKFIWWKNRGVFQEFLDEMQTSPLLKVSSGTAFWRTAFHTILFLMYIVPVYFYFCLTWGMVDWNWEDFYVALETSADRIFSIGKSWENSILYPFLLIFNLVINCHNSITIHFGDMIAVSVSILMFDIACDLRKGIESENFSRQQILELIEAQRKLTLKFNKTFGLACCFYSLYCSPYYAIHVIDMFNLPGFMNRYDTGVYLIYLATFLYCCVGVNTMAKQKKRWLEKQHRYNQISQQELHFFLDDLRWERFGLGSFFVINSALTGE